MRILRIATVPFFVLHHLEGQIRALVAAGHDVIVVTSPGEGAERIAALGVDVRLVEIPREISPLRDLLSLLGLIRTMREVVPDLVHSNTPKAGLLAAIAAWWCRVPIRLHTFTGQAWIERKGLVSWLGRLADRIITGLDTRCYADSASQRDFLIAKGISRKEYLRVLGAGSLGGVDLQRFDLERLQPAALALRAKLGIAPTAKVIVFVGRVTRDKGIAELVAAFVKLKDTVLVLVGPLEPELDPLPAETLAAIERNPAIHAVGYDPLPERYLAFADLLCLPSYREGFGNVVIEAAALGVPCVGTRIVGLTDSIVDGKTGLLVPPKDVPALAGALETLLTDDKIRNTFGAAARERARQLFDATRLHAEILAEYESLRGAK
jgi:glycosyltransferase involved in cell wall biosynthesis